MYYQLPSTCQPITIFLPAEGGAKSH